MHLYMYMYMHVSEVPYGVVGHVIHHLVVPVVIVIDGPVEVSIVGGGKVCDGTGGNANAAKNYRNTYEIYR